MNAARIAVDYWPTQQLLIVALLFTVPALVPAIALLGRSWLLLPGVPLLSSVLAAIAGQAVLIFDIGLLRAWVLVVVFVNFAATIAVWRFYQRRTPPRLAKVRPPSLARAVAFIFVAAGAVAPLAALRRPELNWDARSIWLLHARWFYGGPEVLDGALANPGLAFSHADYPPLVPASAALIWRVVGFQEEAYRLAQLLVATLNSCALIALGMVLVLAVPRRYAALPASLSVLLSFASFGYVGQYSTSGYADLLWAASAAAAAVSLFIFRRRAVGAVALFALTAGLTKNEGFGIAVLLCICLVAIAYRARDRGAALTAGGSLVLLVAWPLWVRTVIPASDVEAGVKVSWDELTYAAEVVAYWMGDLILLTAVLALIAAFRQPRLSRIMLWLMLLASFAAVALAVQQARMGFFFDDPALEVPRDHAWVIEHTQRYYSFSRLLLSAGLVYYISATVSSPSRRRAAPAGKDNCVGSGR